MLSDLWTGMVDASRVGDRHFRRHRSRMAHTRTGPAPDSRSCCVASLKHSPIPGYSSGTRVTNLEPIAADRKVHIPEARR